MGPTALRVKKNMHRQNQIKPCGSWWYIEVLRNKTFGLCKKQCLYIFFFLWFIAMSNCSERVHNIWRTTVSQYYIFFYFNINIGYKYCTYNVLFLFFKNIFSLGMNNVLVPLAHCSCDSVVAHCISSAKGCGFNSQGTHILTRCIAWMQCKSLWIKASAKCLNVLKRLSANIIIFLFIGIVQS